MNPRLRKFSLLAHVVSSVGWAGAVFAFLVISIAAITSSQIDLVRGAYLSMDLLGRFAILPLSLAAIATGLALALFTEWGLFRFYWVLVKFVLTILATVALVLHQFTAVSQASRIAATSPAGTLPDVGGLGLQLVTDASLALLVLVGIAAISVFKPWGRTPFSGQERAGWNSPVSAAATLDASVGLPVGLKIVLGLLAALALAFVIAHLVGGGFGHHGH